MTLLHFEKEDGRVKYTITQEYTYAARTTNGLLDAVSFAFP